MSPGADYTLPGLKGLPPSSAMSPWRRFSLALSAATVETSRTFYPLRVEALTLGEVQSTLAYNKKEAFALERESSPSVNVLW